MKTPTYVFMNVLYADGRKGQAARDSYSGVMLKVDYGSYTETRSYFTGDFVADYNAAVEWVRSFGPDKFPFMGSSSVDSFMYDAGYSEETEDVPFASDADLARDEADEMAKVLVELRDALAEMTDLMEGQPRLTKREVQAINRANKLLEQTKPA